MLSSPASLSGSMLRHRHTVFSWDRQPFPVYVRILYFSLVFFGCIPSITVQAIFLQHILPLLFDFCLFFLFTLGARLCRFNKVHLLIDARYTLFCFFHSFLHKAQCVCCLCWAHCTWRIQRQRASMPFCPLKMSNLYLIAQFDSRTRFIW